jgi:tetratricopeptide (TPR) repeat protein
LGLFGWLKRKKGIKLDLKCLACGRGFQQTVEKLLCDLNTMDRKKRGEQTKYSEYIIPERVTCPHCRAVDQFELGGSTYIKLTGELLKVITSGGPVTDSPVQFVHMALQGGRKIHPLEARDWYAEQVAGQPDRADLRVKYANVLRNLGYHEESESQYRIALDIDPGEIEALMNLAFLCNKRQETGAARELAQRLIEAASKSKHPQRKEFAEGAQALLAGLIKPGEFGVAAPELLVSARAKRASKPASGAGRKKPKRKSR